MLVLLKCTKLNALIAENSVHTKNIAPIAGHICCCMKNEKRNGSVKKRSLPTLHLLKKCVKIRFFLVRWVGFLLHYVWFTFVGIGAFIAWVIATLAA